MHNEDDFLVLWDDVGDELVEIKGVFNEAVRQVGKLLGCTHAHEVRSNATRLAGDVRNYVPPQVRRSWIAVDEEHHRVLLWRGFPRCSVYVGHFGVEDLDALKGEGEVR